SDDSLHNVVSRGGSRVFFMAPDPVVAASANPGTTACSAATGEETACPPQLYVWQAGVGGGEPTVRWISRAEDGLFGLQDASLLGQAFFEGATPDGDKVFFRTSSPLTMDDPNGVRDGLGNTVPPPPGGVVSGNDSLTSWDLYMYDFPDDPAADPGDGELTRVSGGPAGAGDCNNPQGPTNAFTPVSNDRATSLRFVSDDGSRVLFVCSAPLPGVGPASNGTTTSPGGSPTAAFPAETNLYLYDTDTGAPRWRFVARLPRATATSAEARRLALCASTGGYRGNPLAARANAVSFASSGVNCFDGLGDGGFVSFFTPGGLVAGDDAGSGDVYGYDMDADVLVRLSEPEVGAAGGSYGCGGQQCFGDGGFDHSEWRHPLPLLSVVREPGGLGGRVVLFQSRSRLVPEDLNDVYDVYSWRDGDLSLVTSGGAGADHVLYKGMDRSARNVYVATRENLSWQDVDRVGDIYVARVGGGFAQPPEPVLCAVLVGGCVGPGGGVAWGAAPVTATPGGGGDAEPGARRRLSIGKVSRAARRRAARRGVLVLRVRSSGAGRVRLVARARVAGRRRVVGRASKVLREPGSTRLRLRLRPVARRALGSGVRLRVRLVASQAGGALPRRATVRLRRPGR
ncbi:MAG TPA: hypothetical protein VHH53_13460, partial [Pseudonocardiaceae bacterium]|nr:hypothetical protein [Pseudonocardiaceae bacterium]